MEENQIEKTKWEIALDAELVILKQCQLQKNMTSCMSCDKLLDCEVRDRYIKIVYESMNKGSGGGFEF